MTIATRLKLNILLSAAVVLIMSLAFAIGFMVEKRASDRVIFADTLSGGMYDLTVLTEYFLKHPEGRPEMQWNIKYDSLSRLLGEAPPKLFQGDLGKRMSQSLADLKGLFQALASMHEHDTPDRTGWISSGTPSGDPMQRAREEQLTDLITLRLREISGMAERISLESSSAIRETSRSIGALIALFSALILILAIRFSRAMQKAITVPIERLQESTAIVRSGDLDHRIPVLSGDELGQLTESFNEMTGYLKASTVSRNELMTEVEERRLAESELHRSQAQLETVIENLAEGLVISDLNGMLLRWNHAALQMHDISSLEEARRRLPEFSSLFELSTLDGTILPVDQWPLARILRGEHLKDIEIRIRSLTRGWERIHNYGGAIVRDAQGQPLLAVVTLSDITERKMAEESLHRQAALIDLSPDGIFIRNMDGKILFWNHGAEVMYGWTKEEAIGETTHSLFQTRFPEPLEIINQTLGKTGRWSGELIHCTREGRDIVVQSFWLAQFDPAGAISDILESNVDITERKAAEEEIRRFNTELEGLVAERTAELESANRELESFSYSVSHDLRAPLRAIEGFSRILEEDYQGSLDEEGKRLLSVIIGSTNNMSKLIDDLLAFSRTGRYELKHNRLDMDALVRSVLNDVVPAQDREKMTIIVHPLAEAVGDPSLMRQVWANLLSNAVKFSSKRERPVIEVGSSVLGSEVLYSVQDNGTGFDMAYAGKLFGVFQRLHSVKEFEGTGVGLAIAQRIVNRHGGRIWAEAKPDKGATFFFTLPALGS